MHYEPRNEPRNFEADAKFVEAGGLKSWGCYAFLLCILAFMLLLVLMHVLLTNFIEDPMAWWASLLLSIGIMAGAVSFWVRKKRRQRIAQEQAWQQAMK